MTLLATSNASCSGVRRTYAFFRPSGLEDRISIRHAHAMYGYAPDEGVDLNGVNVIELLEGLLDLGLVGLGVDNEDKGVVLLNLLHGTLSVQRVNDDLVLV